MRELVRRVFTQKLPDRHPLNKLKDALPSSIDPHLSERADLAARADFLHRHLVIQTHIPKTGGTALFHNLSAIFGAIHSLDVRVSRAVAFNDMKAEEWNDIHFVSGHFNYGMHRRLNRVPLYFAAVREPVSRAVSWYR
ncbi:MAG: sulfotransferase family 2 domain-containing protein, partial [Pseudomonadota bacterium]